MLRFFRNAPIFDGLSDKPTDLKSLLKCSETASWRLTNSKKLLILLGAASLTPAGGDAPRTPSDFSVHKCGSPAFTSFDFLCSSSFNHSNNHSLCPCLTSCGMMCLYAKLSLEGIGYFPQTSLNNLCRCAIYLYYATHSSRLMHEVDLRIIDVSCSMSNGEKAGTKTYSCKRNPLEDFWYQLEVGWKPRGEILPRTFLYSVAFEMGCYSFAVFGNKGGIDLSISFLLLLYFLCTCVHACVCVRVHACVCLLAWLWGPGHTNTVLPSQQQWAET